ncbi:acetylglutamate kinase [Colwellia sp. D2M02]|uniref:acetylglutamate kinase n=1 Tax=Colwellia sp. D2M02 TaxID=2841562 RepID=UPI001C091976|nr:acetylglutamate kinase [Colwellia sp. D2M02]MBU2892799.1 acetylglutamate kinase [Colwellia sp. D2M02]
MNTFSTTSKTTATKPLVIKIGGAILEKESALQALLAVIAKLRNKQVVLVHGGGCVVDEMLAQAGFTTEKKHGLRVTPSEQMSIISGALAGTVNKSIVATANSMGLMAVGLSLNDGDMVSCELSPLELGFVGVPKTNNSKLLDRLLKTEFLPVISSIGALPSGELVNVNADDAAVAICQLLNAELLLLTDVNGVKGSDGEYLSSLDHEQAHSLIDEGVIADGMTAKVNAALHAAKQLRRSIAVASWQSPEQIMQLLDGQGVGTQIQPH